MWLKILILKGTTCSCRKTWFWVTGVESRVQNVSKYGSKVDHFEILYILTLQYVYSLISLKDLTQGFDIKTAFLCKMDFWIAFLLQYVAQIPNFKSLFLKQLFATNVKKKIHLRNIKIKIIMLQLSMLTMNTSTYTCSQILGMSMLTFYRVQLLVYKCQVKGQTESILWSSNTGMEKSISKVVVSTWRHNYLFLTIIK